MKIVFVHGWGLEPSFWDELVSQLDGITIHHIDLGFFGPEQIELPKDDFIYVCHSMGTLWALEHLVPNAKGMFVMNGFTRFTKTDDFSDGLDTRFLKRMIKQFDKNASLVWTDFMIKIGLQAPILPDHMQIETLRTGLERLLTDDRRSEFINMTIPWAALSGGNDQIISSNHSKLCFGSKLEEVGEAGHVLAMSHSVFVADKIKAFMGRWT